MAKSKPRSLLEYDRAKKQAACPVCSLSADLRRQIREARQRRVPQPVILEWLAEEHGQTIKREQYVAHTSGHHDAWDEEQSA